MNRNSWSVRVVALLCVIGSQAAGVAYGRGGFGPGSFGGELRGITRLKGQMVCSSCTLKEAREKNPDQSQKLYQFQKGAQQAVFLVSAVGDFFGNQDASQAGYWQAITGLSKQLAVRTTDDMWQQLTSQENLQKSVEITCLLRSTRALDIAVLTFLDEQQPS